MSIVIVVVAAVVAVVAVAVVVVVVVVASVSWQSSDVEVLVVPEPGRRVKNHPVDYADKKRLILR